MTPKLCKYQCGVMLDAWDEENRKYREAGTGGLHTKERCEEAKAKKAGFHIQEKQEEKNNHGNESYPSVKVDGNVLAEETKKYVDHTLVTARPSKCKIFFSNFAPDVEKDYNEFCAQKGIKGQGAHDHVTKRSSQPDDNSMLFTIYLYYEEVAK